MVVWHKDATDQSSSQNPRIGLCGAKADGILFFITTSLDREVDCIPCIIKTQEGEDMAATEDAKQKDSTGGLITTYEEWKNMLKETGRGNFVFKFADMTDAPIAVPAMPIPVMAVVDGEKVQIGEGAINPETMIFTTRTFDNDAGRAFLTVAGDEISRGQKGTGFVEVSEVTLKLVVETREESLSPRDLIDLPVETPSVEENGSYQENAATGVVEFVEKDELFDTNDSVVYVDDEPFRLQPGEQRP